MYLISSTAKLSSLIVAVDTVPWTYDEIYMPVIRKWLKDLMCAVNTCSVCGRPKYGIIEYSSEALVDFHIGKDNSEMEPGGCVPDVEKVIDKLEYFGAEERNTHLAIKTAVEQLQGGDKNDVKAILLITTGSSESPDETNKEIVKAVRKGMLRFFHISIKLVYF